MPTPSDSLTQLSRAVSNFHTHTTQLCPSEVEDDRARRRTLSSSASSNGIFRTQSPTTLGDGILSSPTPLPREEEKESSVVIRDCHSDMDKMEHDSLTAKGTEVNSTDTVSAPAQHSIPNTLVLLQPDPGESSSNSTASNTQEFSSIRVRAPEQIWQTQAVFIVRRHDIDLVIWIGYSHLPVIFPPLR